MADPLQLYGQPRYERVMGCRLFALARVFMLRTGTRFCHVAAIACGHMPGVCAGLRDVDTPRAMAALTATGRDHAPRRGSTHRLRSVLPAVRTTQRQLTGTIQHAGMRGMAWLVLVSFSSWG
jgi:hypothetical protein